MLFQLTNIRDELFPDLRREREGERERERERGREREIGGGEGRVDESERM